MSVEHQNNGRPVNPSRLVCPSSDRFDTARMILSSSYGAPRPNLDPHPLEPEGIRSCHHTAFPVLTPENLSVVLPAIKLEIERHGEAIIFIHTALIRSDTIHYQRMGGKKTTHRMSEYWRWRSCRKLNLALRNSDEIYNEDGQHRLDSLILRFGSPTIVPAILLPSEGVADEARTWSDINYGNTSHRQQFKSRISQGDANAVGIYRVLTPLGMVIGYHNNARMPNELFCTGTLEKIYAEGKGESALRATLRFDLEAFDLEQESLESGIVFGVYKFLYGYSQHPNFDWKTAVVRIGQQGCAALKATAEKIQYSTKTAIRKPDCLALAMAQAYNFKQHRDRQIAPTR